jgi:hypothetical protein
MVVAVVVAALRVATPLKLMASVEQVEVAWEEMVAAAPERNPPLVQQTPVLVAEAAAGDPRVRMHFVQVLLAQAEK